MLSLVHPLGYFLLFVGFDIVDAARMIVQELEDVVVDAGVIYLELFTVLHFVDFIGRIVNRFLTIGTIISKGKSSGRPPVSDEIVENLKETVEKTLQISIARLSQQSGVPRSTCHKIIKNRLQLHP
jgi:hypothetical protein